MNVRQRKRVLWLASIALAVGAGAALAWGFAVPVRVTPSEADVPGLAHPRDDSPDKNDHDPQRNPSRPPLEELKKLASMDLRQPLYDAPEPRKQQPEPDKPQPKQTPSRLSLRLVGTIQERGHSMAMFQAGDGSIKLCGEGQSVENSGDVVKVTRVDFRTVTIEIDGESRELALPRAEDER